MGLRMHRQVGALWKVLSQQAIGILVRPALPRALRVAKIYVDVGRHRIDFFLKTEMDGDTKKSHDEYKKAIDPLKMIVTDKGEMQNSFANTDPYWAIRNY